MNGGQLADAVAGRPRCIAEFAAAADDLAEDFEQREYARAVRKIMALADRANQYIDERKPWILAKKPDATAEVVGVCTLGLNLFRALIDLFEADRARRSRHAPRRLFAAGELQLDTTRRCRCSARESPSSRRCCTRVETRNRASRTQRNRAASQTTRTRRQ